MSKNVGDEVIIEQNNTKIIARFADPTEETTIHNHIKVLKNSLTLIPLQGDKN